MASRLLDLARGSGGAPKVVLGTLGAPGGAGFWSGPRKRTVHPSLMRGERILQYQTIGYDWLRPMVCCAQMKPVLNDGGWRRSLVGAFLRETRHGTCQGTQNRLMEYLSSRIERNSGSREYKAAHGREVGGRRAVLPPKCLQRSMSCLRESF